MGKGKDFIKSWLRQLCVCASIIVLMSAFTVGISVNAEETVQKDSSVNQTSEGSQNLPAVGDVIHGFKVISEEPINIINAETVVFEHEKSGAKLIYIACDDENRAFDITFQTPALDNKGKPHVFEHITIGGSQKYNDPNLFFPFANNTYNTFVNAMTYHGMTSFPVASLSEKQLMTMMDYYLSGVFDPLLYTEKNLASREAWRYELKDAEAPITIAGTVYSEMQGAYDISRWAKYNDMNNLFAGSPVAYESGGQPDAIRTLSYDELINFHDTYYKPSNSLITLYGKLDYEKFLNAIDKNYFSKYEKEDVYVEKGKIEPFTETHYSVKEAPVEEGTDTENASYIYYSFGADKAGVSDYEDLQLIANLFSQESSSFMRNIRSKLPEANVSVNVDPNLPVTELSFIASNVNESDRDSFVHIVDEAISSAVKNGFTQEETAPAISKEKLSVMMTPEDSDLGVNMSQAISGVWTNFGTLDYYNTVQDRINTITAKDITDATREWLYDNKYRAVSVTVPKPGLAEQKEAALETELAKLKASMTDEQINQMIEASKEFTKWSEADPSEEIIDKLKNVEVKDLDENIKSYDIDDSTTDGIRWMSADVNSNDVYSAELRMDASGIPVDKLQDVELYLNLLGEVGTSTYDREGLSLLTDQYLPYFSAYLNSSETVSGDTKYYANLSWMGLGESTAISSAVLSDMINNTDFSDTDMIADYLQRNVNSFTQTLDYYAFYIQLARCKAVYNDSDAFNEYLSDFSFKKYCKEMIQLAKDDPQALTQRLNDAKDIILNRKNLIMLTTGDGSAIDSLKTDMNSCLSALPEKDIVKSDYSVLRLKFSNEAVVNNMSVHSNLLFSNNTDFTGKDYAISAFIDDKYLLPKLRNSGGAYGAYSIFDRTGLVLYTMSDPNMTETFDCYEDLPKYLRSTGITQDDVDGYIVGCYSDQISSSGSMMDSMKQIKNQLLGKTIEYREKILHEIKHTTVKDIRAAADRIEKLIENGVRSVSGTQSDLSSSGISFDSTMNE